MSELTKTQLFDVSERIAADMLNPTFEAKLRSRIEGRQVVGQALVDEIEVIQQESLAAWGFNPTETLSQLKAAVKVYPGPEMHKRIMKVCDAEEALLNKFEPQGSAGGGHGHSHGGAPCTHNHGHSHNGVPCQGHHGHGHGAPDPQTMLAMQMAVQSLSPEQQAQMQRIQVMMMSGQAPTDADRQVMMSIQQHIMAYMATMQGVLGNAAAAGAKK